MVSTVQVPVACHASDGEVAVFQLDELPVKVKVIERVSTCQVKVRASHVLRPTAVEVPSA
jgi:hypothetical protein